MLGMKTPAKVPSEPPEGFVVSCRDAPVAALVRWKLYYAHESMPSYERLPALYPPSRLGPRC